MGFDQEKMYSGALRSYKWLPGFFLFFMQELLFGKCFALPHERKLEIRVPYGGSELNFTDFTKSSGLANIELFIKKETSSCQCQSQLKVKLKLN